MKLALDENYEGKRTDAVLLSIFPDMSLRARRRLLKSALINGKKALPGYKIKKGDVLIMEEKKNCSQFLPRFLGSKDGFFAFFKPSGMHTASLAGKKDVSLESFLYELAGIDSLHLLQRLDFQTCGIVCTAQHAKAVQFRNFENAGLVKKYYLALLKGKLKEPAVAKFGIDASNRKKVKTGNCNEESLRWTYFEPVPELWNMTDPSCNMDDSTWVLCRISKGQRHQIRAHAGRIGHPLVNDALYGSGNGNFYLRCFCIAWPGQFFFNLEQFAGSFLLPENAAKILMEKILLQA